MVQTCYLYKTFETPSLSYLAALEFPATPPGPANTNNMLLV